MHQAMIILAAIKVVSDMVRVDDKCSACKLLVEILRDEELMIAGLQMAGRWCIMPEGADEGVVRSGLGEETAG